jgi:hypothetical protein
MIDRSNYHLALAGLGFGGGCDISGGYAHHTPSGVRKIEKNIIKIPLIYYFLINILLNSYYDFL